MIPYLPASCSSASRVLVANVDLGSRSSRDAPLLVADQPSCEYLRIMGRRGARLDLSDGVVVVDCRESRNVVVVAILHCSLRCSRERQG